MRKKISSNFPFESKYLEIKESKIHYIDEGEGEPVLFVHGNPTSSYIWRNIIPYLIPKARCIALDLIGMGKSDQPNINYGFVDSYAYFEAFIEKLELKNITLVLHDWGSVHGFHYANLHRDNIRGIAFMEGLYKGLEWSRMPFFNKISFKFMRTKGIGHLMVNQANLFINQMIPQLINRKLTKEEFAAYAAPFKTVASRKPLLRFVEDAPINGKPAHVAKEVDAYHQWLKETSIPKLFFYATPGAAILKEDADWIKTGFPNLKAVSIGKGLHFVQEDNPHTIGKELAVWYDTI